MSDRRDRLPPEYRDLNPEEFVHVYKGPNGELVAGSRDAISGQLDKGRYGFAFDLMRFHLMCDAKAILRQAGCSWRRSDALWLRDINADLETDLAAMVDDSTEFVDTIGVFDAEVQRAHLTLLTLQWQSRAITDAGSEAERDSLRRMGLASASLGFMAGQAGIGGAVPSLREVMALAETAKAQLKGGERGRETLREKADAWRVPLSDYADGWLARKRPTVKSHGMIARIVTDFRTANPAVSLTGSDGPNRLVSERVTRYLAGQAG